MTDPVTMSADEALEVLKQASKYWHYQRRRCLPDLLSEDVHRALAALSGLHAHWSRFKVGDEVWFLVCEWSGQWTIEHSRITQPSQCFSNLMFPTDAEARAECERRNTP